MAFKLQEGAILSKDKVSEAWSANAIPNIFFTILLSTHLVNVLLQFCLSWSKNPWITTP